MDYRELDPRDRRLIIVASAERAQELPRRIDWKAVRSSSLPFATSITAHYLFPYIYFLKIPLIPNLKVAGYSLFEALRGKTKLPYPILDLRLAREQFTFPINHPIDGLVYACCQTEPNLYVPLASFHQYLYEAKMAAFHELCANLGVRHCTVVYAEEDGQDVTTRARASGSPTRIVPGSVDLSTSVNLHSGETAGVFAEYPPPNRPLIESQSGWLNGEPTWGMMQKLRFERNLERWRAEFSYLDDMGINTNVVTAIAGLGLDIGGAFMKMNQRKWTFDVGFWPREAG